MSRRAALALCLAAGLALSAAPLRAQQDETLSTLIADRVEINAGGQLVASGNVEALQGDLRLKASRVIYDPDGDRLLIEGPIVLTQGTETVVVAESADLDSDLQNGLIRSARLVMSQQLQLATAEIERLDGRYTQLYKTVASSCQVCAKHPVPLWQIRASRVVHDNLERQLYFDNAVFEIAGIPVMYIPQLRMPDPTLKRATGFLTPILRPTDELGFGVKIPYFITLGDDKDLTVTPYVATNYTRTLQLRYRQAFRSGDIEINTAVSQDDIRPQGPRAYLFAEGYFDLPRDFKLDFNLELTSDDTYLIDYDFSSKDRLDSGIALTRTRRDQLFAGELVFYKSLRESESNQTEPYFVGDLLWTKRFEPDYLGGEASFTFNAHSHRRRSNENIIGRDVQRLSGIADWQRQWIMPAGFVANAGGALIFDHTIVQDDTDYQDPINQTTPYGIAELRWPWVKATAHGNHKIEPIVQLVWSPNDGKSGPQDESTQLELDEANLMSISRFPAGDVRERGLRANAAVNWTYMSAADWTTTLTVGRIYREQDLGQFDGYRALEGMISNWLTAFQIDFPNNVSLTNRALFDDGFYFNKNETRMGWQSDMLDMSANFIWMAPSPVEGRDYITHEISLEGDWQITERWGSTFDWNYDIELDRSALARLGLEYRTECTIFDFSIRRRFTSSDQLRPTTDYNIEIQLAGFGDRGSSSRALKRGRCSG